MEALAKVTSIGCYRRYFPMEALAKVVEKCLIGKKLIKQPWSMIKFHYESSWRNGETPAINSKWQQKNNADDEVIEIDARLSEKKIKNGEMMKILWISLLVFEVCLYSSYSPLVHLCQVDGQLPFSSSSLVLLTEIAKLCISLIMLAPEIWKRSVQLPPLSFCLALTVPAFLYTINNNTAVWMQQEMDPTTYQVLGNMKIATTAVLYKFIMKRNLSRIKWFSLGLLTLAGVLDSLSGSRSKESTTASHIYLSLTGIMLMSSYCFISGLAGVYTEFIFKKNFKYSIHVQNIILYIIGIMFNLSVWFIQRSMNSTSPHQLDTGVEDVENQKGIFHGFTFYTWFIVVTQALNGLIMSLVMKYGSNITRLFIVTCAMLLTTLISVFIFYISLPPLFIVALFLVLLALYLYHSNE